jgi:hypothetical protein
VLNFSISTFGGHSSFQYRFDRARKSALAVANQFSVCFMAKEGCDDRDGAGHFPVVLDGGFGSESKAARRSGI